MEFSASHLIPGMSRAEYEAFFFDETINASMCERLKLERRVISRHREGANLEREVEVTMRRQVPAWVVNIVGEGRFVYTETMTYRFGEPPAAARWTIVPNAFKRTVTCEGTVTFETHPQGVMRRAEGNVQVHIPGVGGMLERFAAKEIEKSFAEAASLTLAWLKENPARKAR